MDMVANGWNWAESDGGAKGCEVQGGSAWNRRGEDVEVDRWIVDATKYKNDLMRYCHVDAQAAHCKS